MLVSISLQVYLYSMSAAILLENLQPSSAL